jgi:hypothetical protein
MVASLRRRQASRLHDRKPDRRPATGPEAPAEPVGRHSDDLDVPGVDAVEVSRAEAGEPAARDLAPVPIACHVERIAHAFHC